MFPELTSVSTAMERYRVVKTVGGKLFSATVYNNSAGTLYLQLFNQAGGAPTGTPVATVPVAAAQVSSLDFGQRGLPMTSGVVVALSTAVDSYADPGASGWFTIVYA